MALTVKQATARTSVVLARTDHLLKKVIISFRTSYKEGIPTKDVVVTLKWMNGVDTAGVLTFVSEGTEVFRGESEAIGANEPLTEALYNAVINEVTAYLAGVL